MNFGEIDQYVLFGGGQLMSLTVLQLLNMDKDVLVVTSSRHSIESIVCDGQAMTLLEFFLVNDIDYCISEDVSVDKAVIKRISSSTIGLSFGAAWIFRKEFIDLFEGRLLNLHGARLPQDRGGGGFSWRILRDERVGVSLIHQIEPGVDTGDIVLFEEFIYPSSCRLPLDYINYSINRYQELLNGFFSGIDDSEDYGLCPQQEYFASYWPRLSTDVHAYIDWGWSLMDIESFICAFDDPYMGAMTFLHGAKVRIKKSFSWKNDGSFHPFQKGIIYRISNGTIYVACEDGALLINEIFDEYDNDVTGTLRVGERFYTPSSYLDKALQYRANYTVNGLKS